MAQLSVPVVLAVEVTKDVGPTYHRGRDAGPHPPTQSGEPLWSAERIGDTLRLLGFDPPCEDTIRKVMAKPTNPRQKSTTWLPFLPNHLDVSWAIDFFTVVTVNFGFLYVFVVFDHGRRKVIHFATTYNRTMQWVIQQLGEATPLGQHPRYLFRDNDSIYGHGVRAFLNRCNIEEVRTAFRSPWQKPYVERFIGTLRRELLDHVIVSNQSHMDRLLNEYIREYYHVTRPHQGLGGGTPIAQKLPPRINGPSKWIAFRVCGGLHHLQTRCGVATGARLNCFRGYSATARSVLNRPC